MPQPVVGASGSPFFVVGCERSGTTLLRLMLNAHPRLAVPPESNFIPVVFRDYRAREPYSPEIVQEIFAVIERVPGYQNFRLDSQRLLERLRNLERPTLAVLLSTIYAAFAEQEGKVRWGDKTPAYAEQIPRLNALFPTCRVIHVIRDGRDAALSMVERSIGPRTLFDAGKQWVARVERGRRDGRALGSGRYLEIYYEQLVADPERVGQRVCAFLDETFDPRMLTFHTTSAKHVPAEKRQLHEATFKPINADAVGRWQRELRPREVSLLQAIEGSVLRKHGYRLQPSWRAWCVTPAVRGRLVAGRLAAVPRRAIKSVRKRLRLLGRERAT